MNRTVTQAGAFIITGVILLATQGCGMKWVQADGEAEAPKISRGGSSGELSGFSNNPSEERVTQPKNAFSTMMNSPDKSAGRFAEITKEERAAEKAAIEAGLQDVFFGYDQWTLSDAGMEALNQDVQYLKENPRAVLRIGGHCDERGTSDYNLVLGDKRAKAALSYLVESGVKSKQVSVVSYGKERPFCSDHDEACYQQNRRGHMLLTTKK
jgi:peptidoglycan-associated lipoprotein